VSNRDVIRAYAASYDLRLIEAENGQEALQTLKHLHPDLILMDIHMPVMNGYEATKVIKTDPDLQSIPVVALTAYAMKDQREQFQEIFDTYLSKPISNHDLIFTLAQFLPYTKTTFKEEQALRGTQRGSVKDEMSPFPAYSPLTPPRRRNAVGIFEALKAYVIQAETCPKALYDKLHDELLPKHQEISEVMSVDEMIEFAEAVLTMSDEFQIPPLTQYGEALLGHIKVFDIVSIKRLLDIFPEIVEIICNQEE
jgi:CheY-like chemotaxis protein